MDPLKISKSPSIPEMRRALEQVSSRLNVFTSGIAIEGDSSMRPEYQISEDIAKLNLPSVSRLVRRLTK